MPGLHSHFSDIAAAPRLSWINGNTAVCPSACLSWHTKKQDSALLALREGETPVIPSQWYGNVSMSWRYFGFFNLIAISIWQTVQVKPKLWHKVLHLYQRKIHIVKMFVINPRSSSMANKHQIWFSYTLSISIYVLQMKVVSMPYYKGGNILTIYFCDRLPDAANIYKHIHIIYVSKYKCMNLYRLT